MGAFLILIFSPKMLKLIKVIYHIKAAISVVGLLFMLSPILKTFHSNYADNTTYALATGLIVVHLVFNDYDYVYEDK